MVIPRPEYPRPQFVRADWLNLNGAWEFSFDDSDQGVAENWCDGRQLPDRIVVPFPYQSALSGINDQGIHEVVWYAHSLIVPPEWCDQDVLLHFGAVDYRTMVWLNGAEVGHNQGGHVPFWLDLTPYLREGENRLTLRVEDRQDPDQPRGKQASSGKPAGVGYYCTTGIWQTVWLEPAPPVRVDELRITPQLEENALEVHVYLHAPAGPRRLEVEALDGERVVASTAADTSSAVARLILAIPEPVYWSPDTPHLYTLRLRLWEGDHLLDTVESYAGLRRIAVRDGWLELNGRPTYLAMALDQGYWPEGLLAAPSDDALRADVEWAKRLGFNGVRKHQKIDDPRWLYWCDQLGLLVWGEAPNAEATGWSSRSEDLLLAEWERAVRRDYNHPCVITWVPINESWGVPGLRTDHAGQYAFVERLVAVTRRLDPTRPVVDNDGWEHTDVTDICAIHDYTPSGTALVERYAETLHGGALPPTMWGEGGENVRLFARGARYHGQPVMLTEVGGFLLTPPQVAPEDLDVLYTIYGSLGASEELLGAYGQLLEGIGCLPFVTGFCYTQLTDVEQEVNGLLTYDRQPKMAAEGIAAINRALVERMEAQARYRSSAAHRGP